MKEIKKPKSQIFSRVRCWPLSIYLFFFGTWFSLSCHQDIPNSERTDQQLSDIQLREFLSQSFSNDIKDMGSYFLVEGDQAFRKDQLSEMAKSARSLSKATAIWCSLKWSASQAANLTYNIDDLSSTHQSEFETAIAQWESSGAGIDFERTSNGNATIVAIVDPSNINGTICGETVFPTIQPPGEWEEYNMRFRFAGNNQANTKNKRLRIIMHEIGHRLGLAHSNLRISNLPMGDPNPCGFVGAGPQIVEPQTTNQGDANSVMRVGTPAEGGCGAERTTISQDDQVGVRWIYPPPPPPSAPYIFMSYSNCHPRIYWSSVQYADLYKVYRSTDFSGTYQFLAQTTSLEYIDDELIIYACNTPNAKINYFYKVKASDIGNAESAFSNERHVLCEVDY